MKKSLILYDFLLVRGGAEQVTLDIYDHFKEMDLGVGFIDKECFPHIKEDAKSIRTICSPTKIKGWQTIKVSRAFARNAKFVNDYDVVIFSGSNAPLAIKHRKEGLNLLYCHTPPRFVYDLKDYYLQQSRWWERVLLKGLIKYFQPKYEASLESVDLIIVNSKNVQRRVKKFLNRDSVVIYPPCAVEKFNWVENGDFYLSTSRLEPYKRVDKIVKAFVAMPDKKLIVASGGSELERLKAIAEGAANITFTGWCSHTELSRLVGSCIATIYLPKDEDFGMSPVESMAAGKPVIGVKEGGVQETVLHGATGILCPENPSVDDIRSAVENLPPIKALDMKDACLSRAQQFSPDTFFKKMALLIDANKSSLTGVVQTLNSDPDL